jgi:hypothetical protein
LFEDCNGDPEIISVKCNKNTIAHNTFVRCLGTVSLRHGNETVIEGNFFFGEGIEGTGGVRIYGSNHKIINNFFQGLNGTKWDAPITLTQGDVESTSTSLSSHYRIENALVANNTLIDNVYGIEIGFNNNGSYSKPPRNVTMAYNVVSGSSNSLVNYINAPTTMVWIDNILFPQGTAVVGTGVSFTTEQAQNIDPKLALDPVFWYMKSTSNTPSFASYATAVGAIASDIEGQARVSPFTYGADQYSTEAVVYKPMLAAEVGPQTGGYLSLSRAVQSFGMGAESADVTLESNLSWGVLSSATWLTCTPTTASSGTKLTISVVANTTGQDRTATLTFTSTNNTGDTNITRVITVTQAGKAVSTLSISATNLSFDAAQASKNFDITSNTTWSIVSSETWLTVNSPSDTGNKTIAAQVAANTSRSARTAKLTISDGANLTAEIAVAQAGTVGTEVKLAVTSVVASTEQVSNEAVNVNDGLLTNRWSGDGDGATITLDLGDLRKISYLVVGIYKGDSRTSSFDIQTSTDGITFVNAIVGITTPITTDLTKIYDFADIDARYVRIVGHGNSTGTWNSYTEFEVWGWTAPVVTSVLEPESELTFCVYPNPSKDAFVVSHPEGAKLSIYNVSGICVRNLPTITGTETQVSALPKGLYFLRMNANGAMQTKKIRID